MMEVLSKLTHNTCKIPHASEEIGDTYYIDFGLHTPSHVLFHVLSCLGYLCCI
jgi:hypothetical protein